MAINKQIKIARGSHTSIASITSDKLVAWEPIYDKDRKYLYIWNGEDDIKSLKLNPTITNKIIGYVNDIESNKYEFNADTTGAFIKSNTAQFDVKDTSNNNILSATNSNLIFKGDLKSGDKIIYTNNTDTLTVNKILSRSGGTLSNFTINTGTSITTPKISGVNNTLSIDATSGVNFNGKITSNDLLINSRADIDQINASELAISKTSGIGISCYDSAIATKSIYSNNGTLSISDYTSSGVTNTLVSIRGDLSLFKDGDILSNTLTSTVTAGTFKGNLEGNASSATDSTNLIATDSGAAITLKLKIGDNIQDLVFTY